MDENQEGETDCKTPAVNEGVVTDEHQHGSAGFEDRQAEFQNWKEEGELASKLGQQDTDQAEAAQYPTGALSDWGRRLWDPTRRRRGQARRGHRRVHLRKVADGEPTER